jgi:multiple sugar transport system permease protein
VTVRWHKFGIQTLRYIFVLLALVFFLFPVVWISVTAFKSGDELLKSPPVWIPDQFSFQMFQHVIETGGIKAIANSFIIAASATVLALLIGSLAAYGLARYKVGGNNLPFYILSQRFMPPVAVIFPFLLVFKALRWMDTYQALILIYMTFNLPYAVWMMRGFFLEIPTEVEESALVDGCSPLGAFWHIALPLASPGLVATGVFCFIFSWTEFFFAVCLTRKAAMPLSVFLPFFFGRQFAQWGQVGAVSVLALLPLFFMSLVVQRYLVRGLTMGAVK